MKRAAQLATQRAALIKRQLDLIAGISATPPKLFIGPTRTMVRGADPTKFSTGPIALCEHQQP